LKRTLTRADAEAIRQEIDTQRGFPRVHAEHELVRIGGGIHVETVVTTTAVAVAGDGPEVVLTVNDSDERHVEPARRARLRSAKEPVEDSRGPEDRKR